MNLGRLRVATKGVDRAAGGGERRRARRRARATSSTRRGMYMIGQVAALRDRGHHDRRAARRRVAPAAGLRLARHSVTRSLPAEPDAPPPCDVAIIGMSCFYPKAGGLWQYWENILAKVERGHRDPADALGLAALLRPRPAGPGQDRLEVGRVPGRRRRSTRSTYGITPKSIPSIEPLQLLLLEAVRPGAGRRGLRRPAVRPRADRAPSSASAAAACRCRSPTGSGRACRCSTRSRACRSSRQQIVELGEGILPEWTEDSFPGILLNVAAGRVANRFNLGGPNMAIDAACGSSLAALYAGVRELNDGHQRRGRGHGRRTRSRRPTPTSRSARRTPCARRAGAGRSTPPPTASS